MLAFKAASFHLYTMLMCTLALYCMWMHHWKWYICLCCVNMLVQPQRVLAIFRDRHYHVRPLNCFPEFYTLPDTKEIFLQQKFRLAAAIRAANLRQSLHLTTRNPENAWSQAEIRIIRGWTTGPDAQMRYELLAPKNHKVVSAVILIQRYVRVHQRRVRAVKACQRRIRQLLWIRYELCNPTADMNAQYMHLLDMDTFEEGWGRLTNFWNRSWK